LAVGKKLGIGFCFFESQVSQSFGSTSLLVAAANYCNNPVDHTNSLKTRYNQQDKMGIDLESFIDVTGIVLLFCLVFGMSATVDIGCLYAQLKNRKAIGTGILLQFLVLPFLGFMVVKTLNLNHAMGITLLVVTSSPGGSYSNWYENHLLNDVLHLTLKVRCSQSRISFFLFLEGGAPCSTPISH
jgi:hypothetical protein